MFCQIFFSLQEKQSAIISYKRAIQELPNELPNDFRFRVLGNLEISEKYKVFIEREPSAQSSLEKERFVNTS